MARVLLAGPSETFARLAPDVARLGHDVLERAPSAEAAVEIALERLAELVLIDVALAGDMDGIELAQALRKRLDPAIVFLAGHCSRGLLARATAVHARGLLIHPVGFDALRAAVEIALFQHRIVTRLHESYVDRQQELEREVERLKTLSLVDELTGVLNRRGFSIHAEQSIRVANRNRESLSVLFVDVDGLKQVNDQRGHAAGDELIRQSASLLRETLRDSDILGRVGGDEFAVVALGCTPERLPELLVRIHARIERHNAAPGRGSALSLSVGTVLYDPARPEPIDVLLARADAEMYSRKRAKRGV